VCLIFKKKWIKTIIYFNKLSSFFSFSKALNSS
jgi:hypothetical protein